MPILEKPARQTSKPQQPGVMPLQRALEAQGAGFPPELKAARIILETPGWSFISSPRFQPAGERAAPEPCRDVDLVADFHMPLGVPCRGLGSGFARLRLVIGVKTLARPLVVFASPRAQWDNCDVFGKYYYYKNKKNCALRAFSVLSFDGYFRSGLCGRTCVVVDNDGTAAQDYDAARINAGILGLYAASDALVRANEARFPRSEIAGRGDRMLEFVVPVILADGNVFAYNIGQAQAELSRTGAIPLVSHVIGSDESVAMSPAFLMTVDELPGFLRTASELMTALPVERLLAVFQELEA